MIGNDSYASVETLRNARADADTMAAALRKAGYAVTLEKDRTLRQMKDTVRAFRAGIGGGDEVVFYFSGHGVQIGGMNQLLPIDVRAQTEDQVRDDSIALGDLLADIARQKPGLTLAIIDACRDNPFPKTGRAIGGRGLTGVAGATGQMVIYSAGEGQQALDRLGDSDPVKNGVFTRVFIREMEKRGVSITEVVRVVREEVYRLAQSANHEQVPAIYDQVLGRFFFYAPISNIGGNSAPAQAPATASATDPAALDLAFWNSIKDSKDPQEFAAYLEQYPAGQFASLARVKQKQLQPQPQALAAAPAPVQPALVVAPAPAPAPAAKAPGTVFRDCADCSEMVVVPAGKFAMGSPPSEEGRYDAEGPVHQVSIDKPFALGRYAVTFGEFRTFVRATGYKTEAERNAGNQGCHAWDDSDRTFDWRPGLSWDNPGFDQKDRQPAVCVSWNDAQAYLKWFAQRAGTSYRLPSEAQWEYAARAGTTAARLWGNDPNQACRYANVADQSEFGTYKWTFRHECNDGYFFTAPVGSYFPNAFGLYDMLGNVWQWTEDCWNASYAGAPPDGSAWTGGDCARRVARGGSWFNEPRFVRSAYRFWIEASDRGYFVGFRLARALP